MSDVTSQAPKRDTMLLGIGALCVAGGFYFALVGLGVLKPPSRTNAPGWVIVVCGLVFFAGGIAVMVRGWLGMDDKVRDLPTGTPIALRMATAFAGLAVAVGLALVGTWIAFGGGPRQFSFSMGFISGSASEIIGRVVFGFGAIIVWLFVIAMARKNFKELFGNKADPASR
jgi:hypothetical protein